MSLFRGDLDWIVMRCLEKDRTRRYDTANGLASDIRRYLADEPVEARQPTRLYRLKKFVRRNKTATVAAALILAALVAGAALPPGASSKLAVAARLPKARNRI